MKKNLRICAECGKQRGNTRKQWHFATRDGVEVSCTCPACPRADEPIRRLVGKRGVRFRAVVDATPAGALKRVQKTKTVATLEDARKWVKEVRADVAKLGKFEPGQTTVTALCERWLANRRKVRNVTREGYDGALRPVRKFLGEMRVRDLEPEHVDNFIAWALEEGGAHKRNDGSGKYKPLSARSVRAALIALGAALDLAVRDKVIQSNPVRLAEAPPIYEREVGIGRRPAKVLTHDARTWTSFARSATVTTSRECSASPCAE